MGKNKELSKKQRAVLNDLFSDHFDTQTVLETHGINRSLYNRWLGNEAFTAELSRRIGLAHLQSELLIARYASLAAAKLVQLTESDKAETARKACLDIITLPSKMTQEKGRSAPSQAEPASPPVQLSEQTASRLLAALADSDKTGK